MKVDAVKYALVVVIDDTLEAAGATDQELRSDDVRSALQLYHDHFRDKLAGTRSKIVRVTPATERLLDQLEAGFLNDATLQTADAEYDPGYLDALYRSAFASFLKDPPDTYAPLSAPAQEARVVSLPQEPRSTATHVYQLKITLVHSNPSIWRRVLVPASVSVGHLHDVIQLSFGWTNSHLHGFRVGQKAETLVTPFEAEMSPAMKSYAGLTAEDLFAQADHKVRYVYDYGDSWEHDVVLEKTLPRRDEVVYPVCLAGERNGPIEDVGGIPGYEALIAAINDPTSDYYEHALYAIGKNFDPAAFDVDEINERYREYL